MGTPITGKADRPCAKCGRVTPHEIVMDRTPACLRCREIDQEVEAVMRRREVAQRVEEGDRERERDERSRNADNERRHVTLGLAAAGLVAIGYLARYVIWGGIVVAVAACGGDPRLTEPFSWTTCADPPPAVTGWAGDYSLEWQCIEEYPVGEVPPTARPCDPANNPLIDETQMLIGAMSGGIWPVQIGALTADAAENVDHLEIQSGTDNAQRRESGEIVSCVSGVISVRILWRTIDGQTNTWWAADAR